MLGDISRIIGIVRHVFSRSITQYHVKYSIPEVAAMDEDPAVKYIGMQSLTTLGYAHALGF